MLVELRPAEHCCGASGSAHGAQLADVALWGGQKDAKTDGTFGGMGCMTGCVATATTHWPGCQDRSCGPTIGRGAGKCLASSVLLN